MGAVCALTVWLLGVLAVSQELHGTIHEDADHESHTCAVTLYREGLVDSLGHVDLVVAPALYPAGKPVPAAIAAVTEVEFRQPPGRGPPLS